MGCGSSKSATSNVEKANDNKKKALNGINHNSSKKIKMTTPKKPATMGNAESELLPGSVPESDQTEVMPPPVSFDIPADSSLIKKHPPKRLQKLEEQQISANKRNLQEKQMNAEERRQKLLHERVQSSRRSANPANRRTHHKDSSVHEQVSKKFLKVPRNYR